MIAEVLCSFIERERSEEVMTLTPGLSTAHQQEVDEIVWIEGTLTVSF